MFVYGPSASGLTAETEMEQTGQYEAPNGINGAVLYVGRHARQERPIGVPVSRLTGQPRSNLTDVYDDRRQPDSRQDARQKRARKARDLAIRKSRGAQTPETPVMPLGRAASAAGKAMPNPKAREAKTISRESRQTQNIRRQLTRRAESVRSARFEKSPKSPVDDNPDEHDSTEGVPDPLQDPFDTTSTTLPADEISDPVRVDRSNAETVESDIDEDSDSESVESLTPSEAAAADVGFEEPRTPTRKDDDEEPSATPIRVERDQPGPDGDRTAAAGGVSVAAAIPPRHSGNVRTQWGITAYPGTGQQYANVKRLNPTEAPAPVLRQEIIEMRRRAQSEFINESLAPIEAISSAFQPPITGVAPYYYGSYTSPFMG